MRGISSLGRLALVSSLAFLSLLVVSGTAGGLIMYLQHQASRELVQLNRVLQMTQSLRGDLYRQVKEVFDHVFVSDPNAAIEFRDYGRRIEEGLAELTRLAAGASYAPQMADLQKAYEDIHRRAEAIMGRPADSLSREELLAIFEADLEKYRMVEYENVLRAAENAVLAAQRDIQGRLTMLSRGVAATLLAAVAVGLLLLMMARALFRRAVALPVQRLVEATQEYRSGRLDYQVPQTGPVEFITLQKSLNRMADELKRSREAIIRAERQAALGALVPVIAHNIRNPLASIRATAQVTRGDGNPREIGDALDDIVLTVDRLEDWVSSLLCYLDPPRPVRTPTKLAELADGSLRLMEHHLSAKDIRVVRIGWEAAPDVSVDPSLMEQALCGLLTNAIEASPSGAQIAVKLDLSEAGALVEIMDQGPGMPFCHHHSGLTPGPTTKHHGSGLGVPFARRICEIHDGRLEFAFGPGGGTSAVITLPQVAVGDRLADQEVSQGRGCGS